MTGLLYKELYTLRRYLNSYVAAFLMFIVLSAIMESGFYLQSMLAMSLGMLSLTGMSYDKMYGWDKMVLIMPLKRSQIVLSKYIANAVMGIVALFLSTGLGIFISNLFKMNDGWMDMCITGAVLFVVLMIIYSVLFPMIYKFGVEQTRIYMAGVVALMLIGFITLIDKLPKSILLFIEEHIAMCGVIFGGVGCVCYIISYIVSVKIYEKKEY